MEDASLERAPFFPFPIRSFHLFFYWKLLVGSNRIVETSDPVKSAACFPEWKLAFTYETATALQFLSPLYLIYYSPSIYLYWVGVLNCERKYCIVRGSQFFNTFPLTFKIFKPFCCRAKRWQPPILDNVYSFYSCQIPARLMYFSQSKSQFVCRSFGSHFCDVTEWRLYKFIYAGSLRW